MATLHALERAAERIGAVLDPNEVEAIVSKADAMAREYPKRTCAYRVFRLGRIVGELWGTESNGDTVVAIIRYGQVHTFMFRRSNQPHDKWAYNTDCVRG